MLVRAVTRPEGHRRRVDERLHALVYLRRDLPHNGCWPPAALENLVAPVNHFFAKNRFHVFDENNLIRLPDLFHFLRLEQPSAVIGCRDRAAGGLHDFV